VSNVCVRPDSGRHGPESDDESSSHVNSCSFQFEIPDSAARAVLIRPNPQRELLRELLQDGRRSSPAMWLLANGVSTLSYWLHNSAI